MTTTTVKTIRHSCGHTSQATVDKSTAGWTKFFAAQPCFTCQPNMQVERLCGHQEVIAREFSSPRRFETAAMQPCECCK